MKKAEVSPVEDPELRMLESKLGIAFKDKRLLVQALTHSSAVNETDLGDSMSNERLEFLGDALIGLVIAQLLFESVKNRLAYDVPFFTTLSGGIDSTLMTYFANMARKNIDTLWQ